MLKAYKFHVVTVLQEVSDGRIVGEVSCEPVTVFGIESLREWCDGVEDMVSEIERAA